MDQRQRRAPTVKSGTILAAGIVLGGIVLALVGLKYRVFTPRDPAATRPSTQTAPTSPPADRAADLGQ